MTRRPPIVLLAPLLLHGILAAGPAAAQFTLETIVKQGDTIDGIGNVISVAELAINNSGVWIVEVGTNAPHTAEDEVLIRNGQSPYLREGQELVLPVGATLDSFGSVNLNAAADSAWNFLLTDTQGLDDNSGLYFIDQLLIQEGDFSSSPGLSSGTPYLDFFATKINDSGQILVNADVDDPAINSPFDQVIMLIETDGVNVLSETVIAKEGDFLPGQVNPAISFGAFEESFDFNNSGEVLYQADILAGFTDAIYLNDAIIAMEGEASPIAGRLWVSLSTPELALSNAGDYVFEGILDGDPATSRLIVSNGAKVAQTGDTFPDIAPHPIFSFGNNPVRITDAGDVLWWANWEDLDHTRDTGLFLNDELIVREGVTTVEGLVVEEIRTVAADYTTSDDGRYILFEAHLEGGFDAAVLLTFDGLTTEDPSPGVADQVNTFTATGASDGAQVAIVAGLEVGATQVPGCADLQVGIESPIFLGSAVAAGGTVNIDRFLPPGVAGKTIHVQAVDRTNCAVGTLTTVVVQ